MYSEKLPLGADCSGVFRRLLQAALVAGILSGTTVEGVGEEYFSARVGQELSWPTSTGNHYQAQWSFDTPESTERWTDLGEEKIGDGNMASLNDFPEGERRYYQVVEMASEAGSEGENGEAVILQPELNAIVELSWLSREDIPYQPMTATGLADPLSWSLVGPEIPGTGGMQTLILPFTSGPMFVRLVSPVEVPESFDWIPLFDADTLLEPEISIETETALITYIGDRARDRHAREDMFNAYDHYLSWYWEERTMEIEIIDKVAKGGTDITFNYTTLAPLSAPEFRAFFRGLNTVAEYHFNLLAPLVGPNQYSATVSSNYQEGNRPLRIGDRVEIEISMFLQAPKNGRTNYYGTTLLYIVGQGIVPWQGVGNLKDSHPIPEEGWLGGKTTLPYQYSNEPGHLFKQLAGNIAPASAQPFMLGRRLHHTDFGNGTHSEAGNPVYTEQTGKLGPLFNARSCVECHVNNGRSLPPSAGMPLHLAGINVGSDATGTPHPVLGSAVQTKAISGQAEGTVTISGYTYVDGTYEDGTAYQLRKPEYAFTGTVPEFHSVRMARPLTGLGLLEAVSEETVIALADPDDDSGNGVSGRAQFVTDPETGELRLGRFGHKARMASLRHQIAAAFNNDMGVTTSVFPNREGESTGGTPELKDEDLDRLTRYIAVLGVQARRELEEPQALLGHELFNTAGCTSCHVREMTTGSHHPAAELRNQLIHPYTDLLLHDMGPGLADNLDEVTASGSEWRTAPLWNIGHTQTVSGGEAYLHDGRARNLQEAILWHGGEAEDAKEAFRTMSASDRAALIRYLKSL